MIKFIGIQYCYVLALLALSACSSVPKVEQRFTDASSATWQVSGKPMVFGRTEGQISRSSRDYIYLASVSVNTGSTRDYFLWIGIGASLGRGIVVPEVSEPISISIFIDAEQLELPLADWGDQLPGSATNYPYDPPVQIQRHLAARVTLDQLVLMTENAVSRVTLISSTGDAREYSIWDQWRGWPSFVLPRQ